jgi:hypothetical protein
MKTPLQIISDYGCPTDSFIDAIHHFSSREDLSHEQYVKGIKDIVGLDDLEDMSYVMVRTLFLYLVQETIRANMNNIIPDMDTLFVECVNKATKHITENPWAVMRFTTQTTCNEDDDSVQISRGGKKEITERLFKELKAKGASRSDIISAFEESTGMSKAGATTYFHALKKEFGFIEKKNGEKVPKKESKQAIADRLYQQAEDKSKENLIPLFAEQLGTTKLGAQTYYYSCKNKFEP